MMWEIFSYGKLPYPAYSNEEVVKAIEKDEVILQVNQAVTPAVFRPVDSDDYFYLVMPIKLTEVRDYDAAPPEINRDAGETADSRY